MGWSFTIGATRKNIIEEVTREWAFGDENAVGSVKTIKHCCGGCEPLIDCMIEAGYDVLNPVQCSAKGMDPQGLVDKYGDRIVFWGGGVDTQKTLPFGTPDEVKAEVKERFRILNQKNGLVFNTIHNIQCNTPIENVVAMFEALGRDV